MSEVRILHTSDIHLDWLFGSMPLIKKRKRRMELERAFIHIIELAADEGANAFLISGDLFHGPGVSEHTMDKMSRQLSELASAGTEVVILPGESDPDLRRSSLADAEGIHILSDPDWHHLRLECGVDIWGKTSSKPVDPVSIDLPGFKDSFRIVMAHPDYALRCDTPIFGEAEIDALRPDYIALGHIHSLKDIILVETESLVRYPGSPFRLSFEELQERSVTKVEFSDGRRPELDEIYIPDRPYEMISFSTTLRSADEIADILKELANDELCLRVVLTGVSRLYESPMKDFILRQFADSFFHIEVLDRSEALTPLNAREDTVRSRFVRDIVGRLASHENRPSDRTRLQLALRMGLAALDGGDLL